MNTTANAITNLWDAKTTSTVSTLSKVAVCNVTKQKEKFILVFHGEDYMEILCQLWSDGYDKVTYNERYLDKLVPHVFIIDPSTKTANAGALNFCKEIFKRTLKWCAFASTERFHVDDEFLERLHQEYLETQEVNSVECEWTWGAKTYGS